VEAVKLVPPNHRGSALGAYSLFLDFAMGITGPIAGLIVTGFGYPEIFLFAMLCAVVATGIALALYLRAQQLGQAKNATAG
jgi:MFS family permease